MADKKQKENQFRLVIFSEKTFEEVRSFIYKPWYLWVAIIVFALIIFISTLAVVSLAPIRQMINQSSGYADPEQILELREKVIELEDLAASQQIYINNLRAILSGNAILDTSESKSLEMVDSVSSVARIEEDEQLRNTFDLDEKLSTINLSQSQSSATLSNLKPLEQLYLIPPITGSISYGFDPENEHLGLDINAPPNTPVKAVLDGYIIYAGWTLETGNTIGIQHDNNLISFYKHNSELLKKTGAIVQAGEAVAIIGNTGTQSTGPHLHFELWSNGKPINPANYINFE